MLLAGVLALKLMPSPAWAVVIETDNANSIGFQANVPTTAVNLLATPGTILTVSGGAPTTPTGEEGTSTSWASLTDGSFGGAGTGSLGTKVTIHNGWILTYTFADSHDLATAEIFSGWQDGGRMQPNCTVKYATAADPTTFITLKAINYAAGGNSAWVHLANLNVSAKAIRFEFGTQQNGYVGYAELAVQAPTVNPTLVARYTFEGTAVDTTGNGHDGTIQNGATYAPGYAGQALNCTASSSQWVSVPYNGAFGLTNFTVSAWVNVNTAPGTFGILGTRIGGPDTTFDLKVSPGGIHGDVGSGSGWINTAVDINSGALALGTWHLVTYVVNDATKQFVLYLDGTPRVTTGYSGTALFMQPGQTLGIGIDADGGFFMDGKIDDVRIYNGALSSAEVEALYAGASPWTTSPWNNDASSGVDASYNYTHAYNFSSSTEARLNKIIFTPIWAENPSVAGRFSAVIGSGGQYAGDVGNNLTTGGSRNLANDFLYNANPASLTLNRLVPGRQYVLSLFSTAWDGNPGQRLILFSHGSDQRIIDQDAYRTPSVRGGIVVTYTYTATSDTEMFTMTQAGGGSFHCYGFANREATVSTYPWSYAQWTSDATSGVNPAHAYTHAYNLGSSANATINTVGFTGVDGANPAVNGRFTISGMGKVYAPDSGAAVTGNGATIASSFIYDGNPGTLTLYGLTPGKDYELSLFSTDWANETPGTRVISFSGAGGQRAIDQDAYGTVRNGIVISYAYTADASGSVTVQTTPLVSGNTLHFYGFANREAALIPIAAQITLQPQSISVSPGLDVPFTVAAIGEPPPAFLWLKNGSPLVPNATNTTLTLTAVTTNEAGNYQVVVTNSGACITSSVAILRVGMPMINPSFEVDNYPNQVGYISQNFPITGWTVSTPGSEGINPIGNGQFWFTDNGAIPHGRQAVFIQSGAISQTLAGLTVGQDYYVEYYENARNCCGGTPGLIVTVSDGVNPALTIVPNHAVTPVLGINPYHHVISYGFSATATSLTLTFTKTDYAAGDSTVLLDNISFLPLPAGTPPVVLLDPQSTSGNLLGSASFSAVVSGSSPLHYQWRKDGADIAGATAPVLTLNTLTLSDDADYSLVLTNGSGSATSAVAHLTVIVPVNGLFNTGLDNNRAPLAGGTTDPHFTLLVNPDSAAPDALVETAIPGAWMADSASSLWIGPRADTSGAAGGDYTYRIAIDLTGRDLSRVYIQGQWSSDNGGFNIAVNGADTGIANSGNFGAWSSFVLASTNTTFVSGTNTIDFKVNNASIGFTGLRVQFTSSHAPMAAGTAPSWVLQPQGSTVTLGQNVVLSGNALGSAPLAFQWFKNGMALSGQSGPLLALPNFAASDSGDYTLVVTNSSGSITSAVATLQQIYLPMIGLFNTGVDNSGVLLTAGLPDPHYILTQNGDPFYPTPMNAELYYNGAYMADGPSSRWISPDTNGTTHAALDALYTYSTSFEIPTTIDPTLARIDGQWAMDNLGVDIRLNGVSLGIANNNQFTVWTPFVITNGFVLGSNNLEFVISNQPPTGATALRIEMTGKGMTNLPVPPEIVHQPTNSTVAEGHSISLSVDATGYQPLSYEWFLSYPGFGDYSVGRTRTLTFSSAGLGDAGDYFVVVSNSLGSVTSLVATLTVIVPPSIEPDGSQPQSQSVECQDPASFSVTPGGGSEPFAYQWYHGVTPLTDQTNSTLALDHAILAQAGDYVVVIANFAGSVTSAVAVLTVHDTIPPEITCPTPIIATNTTGGGEVVTFAPLASDSCGLPDVLCVPPSGSSFPLGITRVDCSATDGGNNSVQCHFNVEVRTLLVVTGHVALEAFVGPARDGHGSRDVVFMATDDATNVLSAWTNTLTFAPGGNGYGVAPFTVANVPVGTTHLSAKTAWNLRQRLAVAFMDNAAAAEFTGDHELLGGDIHGNNNVVDVEDYLQLAGSWYHADAASDLDGSGLVDVDDYFILASHWYEEGAPR